MTESNAYLAYGIMVTTESLLYAVAAWPKLQGPFTFLDIVQLRCRSGTLRAGDPGSSALSLVQSFPVEVWDSRLARGQTWHSRPVYCSTCMDAWSTFTGLGNSQLAEAIVDVSFDIPPDTTPRFRRLVSRLHLQPVEITDGLFAIAGTEPTDRRRSRGCFRHYEEVCLYSMRPGWKFIAMAQTTW
ncbi:hypothetical protein JCM10450v2_001306 [Rhodotorula kratochvilovae]